MSELGDIKELLQELITNQALHAAEQRTMKEDLDQIKHVLLEGNGQPPLTAQVLTNRLKIERLEEERTDKKMPRSAWVAIVVSSILGVAGIVASVV